MKAELQEKLVDKYPSLFIYLTEHGSGDLLLPICFGLEVGDGWYDLLDGLFAAMVQLGEDVRLTQVKEKFGRLRVYIDGGSDAVHDLIDEHEVLSGEICEVCGKSGWLHGTNWLMVRCEECYKEGR